MTNKEILQADMLDILFEHRNKLYGAYALRKTYDRRLGIALSAALLTVFISVAVSFLKKNNEANGPVINDPGMIIKTIEIEKEKEPEKPKEKVKPQVATKDYQPIIIVKDKDADSVIVQNNELENAAIANKTQDGDKPKDDTKAITVTDNGEGNNQKENIEVKPDLPSYPPKFPGGSQAWLNFLQRYLQAPEDLEPGQKIEVRVRFWVDVDGSVSRPEIIKSGGSLFDKEVLRVMKKMPKWEPAMQYGNHIAVSYTQPVIFIGQEE